MPAHEYLFPADHAAAPGHFPGNPIMPGALLLAEVLRSVQIVMGAPISPCRIKAAKFLEPVRPGDRVLIDCTPGGPDGAVRFRCVVRDREVLRGEVSCGATSHRG